ncbi:MAG: hypothetical protein WC455_15210 [Dehalococcoidia bacterium]|jgi:hypothetical protein
MATTAHDLIKSALRLCGALDTAQSPEADLSADSLEALQYILDFWSSQGLMIYAQTRESLAITGAASYTIGPGGDFDTTRPEQIAGAYVSSGGLDYPLKIIGPADYGDLAQKSLGGTPDRLFYNPENPLGKIYLYPLGAAGDTLSIYTLKPLTEPTALTDTIVFPPGYKRTIKLNLYVDLAAEFGRPVDAMLYKELTDAKEAIMAKNASARANTARVESIRPYRRYSINEG